MFKAQYIYDPFEPHQHRERQLVAKYGADDCGNVYAVVEYDGYEVPATTIGFNDEPEHEANLAAAAAYARMFNEVWVMVEKTVEALSAV